MAIQHDAAPPQHWPSNVTYLTRARVEAGFPSDLRTLVVLPAAAYPPPSCTKIKKIEDVKHPAYGQFGLVATKKIPPRTMLLPYLGVIHARQDGKTTVHDSSDYDLSLIRARWSRPQPESGDDASLSLQENDIVDIGIDAATAGNSARIINDYRGVPGATKPNAEFRVVTPRQPGVTSLAVAGMEVWSLDKEIPKGQEILVSYGKGFWHARCAEGS